MSIIYLYPFRVEFSGGSQIVSHLFLCLQWCYFWTVCEEYCENSYDVAKMRRFGVAIVGNACYNQDTLEWGGKMRGVIYVSNKRMPDEICY